MNKSTINQIPTKGFRKKFWEDNASSKAASPKLLKAFTEGDRELKENGLPRDDGVAGWSAAMRVYEDLLDGFKEAEAKARSARMKPEDTLKAIKIYREAVIDRQRAVVDKGCEERIMARIEAEKDARAVRDKLRSWLDEVQRDVDNADSLLKTAVRAYEAHSKPLEDRQAAVEGAVTVLEGLLANAQGKAKEAARIRSSRVGTASIWDDARAENVLTRHDMAKTRPLYRRANQAFESFVAFQNEVALLTSKLGQAIPAIETTYEKALNLALSGADLDRLRVRTLKKLADLQREVEGISTELEGYADKMETQASVKLPKAFERLDGGAKPEAIKTSYGQMATYAKQDFDSARGVFSKVKHYRQRCDAVNPALAAEPEIQAMLQGTLDDLQEAEEHYRRVVNGQKEVTRLIREIFKQADAKAEELAGPDAAAPAG